MSFKILTRTSLDWDNIKKDFIKVLWLKTTIRKEPCWSHEYMQCLFHPNYIYASFPKKQLLMYFFGSFSAIMLTRIMLRKD
jgi:hypothetical protein